nr:hypothetical protein [Fusobacterium necrophorum]
MEEVDSLIKKLEPFSDSLDITMEAIGYDWINLFSFLLEKNSLSILSIPSKQMVAQ